jgi:methylated-DNA-[protein]-cysteine S-methyltransferase
VPSIATLEASADTEPHSSAHQPENTNATAQPTSGITRSKSVTKTSAPIWYIELDTPIGVLVVTSEGDAVTGVYMETTRHTPIDRDSWHHDTGGSQEVLRVARAQLEEYFNGSRIDFDINLLARGTDVQRSVWKALSAIPYGETRSYGEIAHVIGNPKASRAVGAANGRNPIPIIVPCHRVIGSNGSLTGFGGGIERKEWLLAHESRVSGRPLKYGRRDLFDSGE